VPKPQQIDAFGSRPGSSKRDVRTSTGYDSSLPDKNLKPKAMPDFRDEKSYVT